MVMPTNLMHWRPATLSAGVLQLFMEVPAKVVRSFQTRCSRRLARLTSINDGVADDSGAHSHSGFAILFSTIVHVSICS